MNFILFTNQGYPLQNSSLGQLHSDGGVVSIDSSSAERLLLVYLPACQLRSSGYYPKYKMAPFQVVFEPGERKEATGTEIRRIRGLGKHRNAFLCQKFFDGDCRVTWGVVVVQHPSACDTWSHTCHPFPESFKDFPIKSLIDILSLRHKFLGDDPLTIKKVSIDLILNLLILAYLGQGEFAVCHSRLWRFVSGSYFKIHDSSPVITRLKNSGCLSRRSRRSRDTSLRLAFCSVVRFFGIISAHTLLMSKSCVKI